MSYNVEIGEWVFETFHWSRYAMSDDDDDDDDNTGGGGGGTAKKTPGSAAMMPPPPALGPAGRVPRPRGAAKAPSKGVCVLLYRRHHCCLSAFIYEHSVCFFLQAKTETKKRRFYANNELN